MDAPFEIANWNKIIIWLFKTQKRIFLKARLNFKEFDQAIKITPEARKLIPLCCGHLQKSKLHFCIESTALCGVWKKDLLLPQWQLCYWNLMDFLAIPISKNWSDTSIGPLSFHPILQLCHLSKSTKEDEIPYTICWTVWSITYSDLL